MPYEHLRIEREVPVNQRRARGFPRVAVPANPQGHGELLLRSFREVRALPPAPAGYDARRLIKLQVQQGVDPGVFADIPGVEFVSQEDKAIVLAFANEEGLATFEARLTSLANGQPTTRKEILYALEAFNVWSSEDRTGWALARYGPPNTERLVLDVELWPLTLQNERNLLLAAFEVFCRERNIEIFDSIRQPSLSLYRLNVARDQLDEFLSHRDIRTVDLPPSFALERDLLESGIEVLGPVPNPVEGVPTLAVLDSGVTAGHPLIAPAMGDAVGFVRPARAAVDDNGHGTMVCGIALYSDVEQQLRQRNFVPQLRLLSGRILDESAEGNRRFIENQVEEAVRYFNQTYGCKVVNLSYGDRNRPFRGKSRVRGLAYTLDRLTRELGVLFVVPTGNYEGSVDYPVHWRNNYPGYTLHDDATLIDPAPSINSLTVGSLAKWDIDFWSQRFPRDATILPIARRDQPSPFTRHGPGANDAIKPELVAYGGNWAVRADAGRNVVARGLGELSTSKDFAGGRLFSEQCGTSFAAPHVANAAAKLLQYLPGASCNLLRAVLVAHAAVPIASRDLFREDDEQIRRVCGYGKLEEEALFQSTDDNVTLFAEASIVDRRNHIYEIPIPEDFLSRGRRDRQIAISLAFSPAVLTTRLDYVATKIAFRFVRASTLDEVSAAFNAATPDDEHEGLPELGNNRNVTSQARSRGTVQASQWLFRVITGQIRDERLFVVVTRNDAIWGGSLSTREESYALVIRICDRLNIGARLYAQIRARLEARIRQRVQVRP